MTNKKLTVLEKDIDDLFTAHMRAMVQLIMRHRAGPERDRIANLFVIASSQMLSEAICLASDGDRKRADEITIVTDNFIRNEVPRMIAEIKAGMA